MCPAAKERDNSREPSVGPAALSGPRQLRQVRAGHSRFCPGLFQDQPVVLPLRDVAHLAGGGNGIPQLPQAGLRVDGVHRHQQAAAGLGIIQQVLHGAADVPPDGDALFGVIPVAVGPGGDQAHGGQVPGLRVEGHVAALDVHGVAAALGHLEAVAQQGKARHVGAAVDRKAQHDIARGLVERRHLLINRVHRLGLYQIRLCRRRENAHAEVLCENQNSS